MKIIDVAKSHKSKVISILAVAGALVYLPTVNTPSDNQSVLLNEPVVKASVIEPPESEPVVVSEIAIESAPQPTEEPVQETAKEMNPVTYDNIREASLYPSTETQRLIAENNRAINTVFLSNAMARSFHDNSSAFTLENLDMLVHSCAVQIIASYNNLVNGTNDPSVPQYNPQEIFCSF